MSPTQAVSEANDKFTKAIQHFVDEAAKLRTGRAHPSMLDGIVVMAYGTPMPLMQVSSVTVPESQQLQITPFDPSNIQAIASAIRDNKSLGLNPSDDGRVVRVPIPALNEERRRDIVKQLNEKQEECMITLRSARHDSIKIIDQAKKGKVIGEDEQKRLEKQVDDYMAKAKSAAEATAKAKESEIMKV